MGEGNGEGQLRGVSFGADENVLGLDRGDSCTNIVVFTTDLHIYNG